MTPFTVAQCASLLAVDESLIRFTVNKSGVQNNGITIDDLGGILEEVLLFKEQYSFLGEFDQPESQDRCFVFFLSYDVKSKSGNAWKVSENSLKSVHYLPNEGRIFIDEDKVWYHKGLTANDDAWAAYRNCVFSMEDKNASSKDVFYCIAIPISSLLKNPPVFKPVIHDGFLYYLDYGKEDKGIIVESHQFYNLMKFPVREHYSEYYISDKDGNRITRLYKWIVCDNDGSIWASHSSYASSNVFYNSHGFIRSSARYDKHQEFSEGLCFVCWGCEWGAINEVGDVVIDCYYNSIKEYRRGIYEVSRFNQVGYIDKEGKAVTQTGRPLVSNTGETYPFVGLVNGKYRTPDLHLFSLEGDDLCYRIKGLSDDKVASCFGVSDEGLYGFLNDKGDVVIPLIYKKVTRFYNGIAKVITENGSEVFLTNQNIIVDITPEEFERIKEEQKEKERRRLIRFKASVSSPYRMYYINYRDGNGFKKRFTVSALCEEDAINEFWNSGVQFDAFIESIE